MVVFTHRQFFSFGGGHFCMFAFMGSHLHLWAVICTHRWLVSLKIVVGSGHSDVVVVGGIVLWWLW